MLAWLDWVCASFLNLLSWQGRIFLLSVCVCIPVTPSVLFYSIVYNFLASMTLHVHIWWNAFCQVCLILACLSLSFCLLFFLETKGWMVLSFPELREKWIGFWLILFFLFYFIYFFIPKGLNFAKNETVKKKKLETSAVFWQHSAENKVLWRADFL